MMKRTVVAACLLAAASGLCALRNCAGADPIVGRWRGRHTGPGAAYGHELNIVKRGRVYVATDVTVASMPLDDALAMTRGMRPKVWLKNTTLKPCAVLQQHVLQPQGAVWVFKNVGVTPILSAGKYNPDHYKVTLDPDGYMYGKSLDNAGSEGLAWFWRVDPPAKKKPLDFAKGRRAQLACWANKSYHFRVSTPQNLDPAKPTPVIIYHSPGGNGSPPASAVASRLGWVSLGLTESKNGPFKPCIENREAVLFHLRSMMTVHPRRVYFAGFSGGARNAYKSSFDSLGCLGGTIGTGAGLPGGGGVPIWNKPVFCIVGKTDMNNGEVRTLYNRLIAGPMEADLIIHPGGHSSASETDMSRAVQWMEYEWFSGAEKLEPSDKPRLEAVAKELLQKAAAPGAEQREACYWLSRLLANRKKDLPMAVSSAIRKMSSHPVYKQESQVGTVWRRLFAKRLDSRTKKALIQGAPQSTIAGRLQAAD